jgi:hypothetical protein
MRRAFLGVLALAGTVSAQVAGREVAIERHLADDEEFQLSPTELIQYGKKLFKANWTAQDGGGRPKTNGSGNPVADPMSPLTFPRNFNRISGPEANSCAGSHNLPFVGGGDIVSNVFVMAQRFDFATFSRGDSIPARGALDERGQSVTLQSIGNSRATIGMFGSGFIEMLARQMTADLQAIRDVTPPGGSGALVSKGVSFGVLSRRADGSWDISKVEGLPTLSLATTSPDNPPSLAIRPFHQAGKVISLREFTNSAFNQHHGMQSTERFGVDTDPDGYGVVNELTRADITAAVVFQATLPVPVEVAPNDLRLQSAAVRGRAQFSAIGCATCHLPALPLDNQGWTYSEPNPYNLPGNLRLGEAPVLKIDLTSDALPGPRLKPDANGVVWVRAFTDLKLHDICTGPDDPNVEPLDMQAAAGSDAFFAGNSKFITRKLWGFANDRRSSIMASSPRFANRFWLMRERL